MTKPIKRFIAGMLLVVFVTGLVGALPLIAAATTTNTELYLETFAGDDTVRTTQKTTFMPGDEIIVAVKVKNLESTAGLTYLKSSLKLPKAIFATTTNPYGISKLSGKDVSGIPPTPGTNNDNAGDPSYIKSMAQISLSGAPAVVAPNAEIIIYKFKISDSASGSYTFDFDTLTSAQPPNAITLGSISYEDYPTDFATKGISITIGSGGSTETPTPTPVVNSVGSVSGVTVNNGTNLATSIGNLPTTVGATLDNGTNVTLNITWATSTTPAYSATTAGTYNITGTLSVPSGQTFKLGTVTTIQSTITVLPAGSTAKKLAKAPEIEPLHIIDKYVKTSWYDLGVPTQAKLTFTDGTTSMAPITWTNQSTYNANKGGEIQTFTGYVTLGTIDPNGHSNQVTLLVTLKKIDIASDVDAGIKNLQKGAALPANFFPTSVNVTYAPSSVSHNTVTNVGSWTCTETFDSNVEKQYTFTAPLIPNDNNIINPTTYVAKYVVNVTTILPTVTYAENPTITDFIGTPWEQLNLPLDVKINGTNETVAVTWNGAGYNDSITTHQTFTGTLQGINSASTKTTSTLTVILKKNVIDTVAPCYTIEVPNGTTKAEVQQLLASIYPQVLVSYTKSPSDIIYPTDIKNIATPASAWTSTTYIPNPAVETEYTFKANLAPDTSKVENTSKQATVNVKVLAPRPTLNIDRIEPNPVERTIAKGTTATAAFVNSLGLSDEEFEVYFSNTVGDTDKKTLKATWTAVTAAAINAAMSGKDINDTFTLDGAFSAASLGTGFGNSANMKPQVRFTITGVQLQSVNPITIVIPVNGNLASELQKQKPNATAVLNNNGTANVPYDYASTYDDPEKGTIFNAGVEGTYYLEAPLTMPLPNGIEAGSVNTVKITVIVSDKIMPSPNDAVVLNHYENNNDKLTLNYPIVGAVINVYQTATSTNSIAQGTVDANGVVVFKKSTHSKFVLKDIGDKLYLTATDPAGVKTRSERAEIVYPMQPVRVTIKSAYSVSRNGTITIKPTYVPTEAEITKAGEALPVISWVNTTADYTEITETTGNNIKVKGLVLGTDDYTATYPTEVWDEDGNPVGDQQIILTTKVKTTSGSYNGGGGTATTPPKQSNPPSSSGDDGHNPVPIPEAGVHSDAGGIYFLPVETNEIARAAKPASNNDGGIIGVYAEPDNAKKQYHVRMPIDQLVSTFNYTPEAGKPKITEYEIRTPVMNFKIPVSSMKKDIGNKTTGYYEICVDLLDKSKNHEDISLYLGDKQVYDVYAKLDGVRLSKFLGDDDIVVTSPYKPGTYEEAERIVAYEVIDDLDGDWGVLDVIPESWFDERTNVLSFSINHQGHYVLGQDPIYFVDIDSTAAWAKRSINFLAARKVLNGMYEKHYEPDSNVTREQFCKMLVLTFKLYDTNATSQFSDVKRGTWYYSYVASAEQAGITVGYYPGDFGEELPFGTGRYITREEMAAMVIRTCRKMGLSLPQNIAAQNFTDGDNIQAYAVPSVKELQQAGVINGMGDGTYAPRNNTRRSEAAKIVYGIYGYKLKGKLRMDYNLYLN